MNKPLQRVLSIHSDRHAVEGYAQILAHGLDLLVSPPGKPRQGRISREEIRPAFKCFRHLDSELESTLRRSSGELVERSTRTVVRAALAGLGGGLLLAGLILIIAENWEARRRGLKLGGWELEVSYRRGLSLLPRRLFFKETPIDLR